MDELQKLKKELEDLKKQEKVKNLKKEIEKYKPSNTTKTKNVMKRFFAQRGNEQEVMDRMMGM
jgi:hypothetical protein